MKIENWKLKITVTSSKRAFSLVEILLAMAIFTAMFSSLAFLSADTFRFTKNNEKRIAASLLIQDVVNAVQINKNELWQSIVQNTDAGPKSIIFQNGRYTIVDGSSTKNDVTTYFTVDNVFRDASGNIVTSGGTEDPRSRSITLTGSWTDIIGQPVTISTVVYVNNWSTLEWVQTTQAEFNTGSNFQTRVVNNSGGEVQVDQVFYPDWCKPTLAINTYNIPGSATAKTVFAATGHAYLGTAGNSTGDSFTKLNIAGVTPPSLTVEGVFNGYLTNHIYVKDNYAYLSTTDNNKEVVILDITTTPYTEVGYVNVSGTTDANAVALSSSGTIGYVAVGRKAFSFDLSSKSGSRSILGEVTLLNNPNWGKESVAKVSKIAVVGNYLYGSLDEDYYELAIANVANPASMSVTSQTSVNNQQTFDIYVSSDGNRTYFGTGNSSSEREFFIINTSSKSGARPIVGRYDTNGMSVKGIAIIEADKRAILVGSGAEEYQAVNIANESSPVRCGGMQLNSGINDVDSVSDAEGNAFSYLVTNDASNDFQILRGGPGSGGGSDGYGYLAYGEFTSQVFDTQSATSSYYTIEPVGVKPASSNVRVQVRTAATADMSGATFVGPDGTSSTYFQINVASSLPNVINGKRYLQYRVYLDSDTFSTPDFTNIKIDYQK